MSSEFKQCPEIIEYAKKNWGITEKADKSGWLLPDGKMLDMSEGGDRRQMDHHLIKFPFKEITGFYPQNAIRAFICECNAIRFYQTPYFFDEKYLTAELDVCQKPTEIQYRKLKEIMEDFDDKEIIWDITTDVKGAVTTYRSGTAMSGVPKRDIGNLRREFNKLKNEFWNE